MPKRTLVEHLAREPLRQFGKAGLFSWGGLRLSRLLLTSAYVYEAAALLARARVDKLDLIEEMLGEQRYEGPWSAYLQQLAQERLDQLGKEPSSFFGLVWNTEMARLGYDTGLDFTTLRRVVDQRMGRKDSWLVIERIGLEGIGFGSAFPEMTEKIYRKAHEQSESLDLMEAWARGASSTKQPRIPLEEQEQRVLSTVAAYARAHYSNLVEPLGLTDLAKR